jgi:hypothetical protein
MATSLTDIKPMMKTWWIGAAAAVLLFGPFAVLAGPEAEVEGLQMPAWVVREGTRVPLALGTRLRNRDEIITGAGSRALLRMADGSTVKLGENARFRMDGMHSTRSAGGLFRASLAVVEGAFRFTTEAVYKFRGKREIDVSFGTVTAGIRGTDLWGKSAADREIVCLIEGMITVTRAGDAPITMQDAKTVYQAPKAAPPGPVVPVDPQQLARWAAETEIQPGGGAVRKGGKWRVSVAREDDRSEAQAVVERLWEGGYPAQVSTLPEDGRMRYWVHIDELPDRIEARALADRLRGQMGITQTSISLQ